MSDFKSESPHLQAGGAQRGGIGRRRLLRAGLAATPVVLAVSGRSAMAQTACPTGLSMLTFASINPSGDGETCITSSHTHTASTARILGLSPSYWKPNPDGQTFQPPYRWPVAPFVSIEMAMKKNARAVPTARTVEWNPAKYTDYRDIASDAAGWATGTKFNAIFYGSSESRSFSRILLDDNGSTAWHFCAAYLNAAAMPAGTYAITIEELLSIAATGRLMPGGNQLTDGQIKAFLAQTWA